MDGLARKAIKTVKSSRFKLITNEQSIFDGHLRLQNLKKELNLKFDPLPYFELFLIQNKIHIVPNENNYKEYDDSSINNSDKHLIPVIKKYEGWLLTSDLTLIPESKNLIEARLPKDVIAESNLGSKDPQNLFNTIFTLPPLTENEGSIFVRIIPAGWGGKKDSGEHNICNIPNVGRIFYDSSSQEWVFQTTLEVEARASAIVLENQNWAVCGTYKLTGAYDKSKVCIFAGMYPDTVTLSKPQKTGKIFEKININNQNLFPNSNIYLRAVVTSSKTISPDTWKSIVQIPEAAINPYDSDGLRLALKILNNFA